MNYKLNAVIDYALIILTATVLSSCIAMKVVDNKIDKRLKKQAIDIQDQSQRLFKEIEWNGHTWTVLVTEQGVGLEHSPDCTCGDSRVIFDI